MPGREIDLRIERKNSEYEAPKMKPFSCKGNQLGSLTPSVTGVGPAAEVIDVDEPPAPVLSAEGKIFSYFSRREVPSPHCQNKAIHVVIHRNME